MNLAMGFYEFIKAAHIKRWHVVNTANQQSLAEHQYSVTVIGMELHSLMAGQCGGLPSLEAKEKAQLMAALLFHDIPEARYGDIPTPGKKFIKERAGHDIFDLIDADLMPNIPYMGGDLVSRELIIIIKLADAIEAAHWISENGLGRHAEVVAAGCRKRLERLLAEYTEVTGHDWYTPVNKILMQLGVPYISNEERLTPP